MNRVVVGWKWVLPAGLFAFDGWRKKMVLGEISEAVWMALISGIVSLVTSLCGVVVLLIGFWSKMADIQTKTKAVIEQNKVQEEALKAVSKKVGEVAVDAATIHINTNSMGEKLLLLTEQKAELQGAHDERMRADVEKATMEQGLKEKDRINGTKETKLDVEHLNVDKMTVKEKKP